MNIFSTDKRKRTLWFLEKWMSWLTWDSQTEARSCLKLVLISLWLWWNKPLFFFGLVGNYYVEYPVHTNLFGVNCSQGGLPLSFPGFNEIPWIFIKGEHFSDWNGFRTRVNTIGSRSLYGHIVFQHFVP